jgi:PAS domain S-box-containing protein
MAEERRTEFTRLCEALDALQKGFALYGPDDCLLLCNGQYRSLLYPGHEYLVSPGQSFETIIRNAAERGLIMDAIERPSIWLADRMARHHDPGEPHEQQRNDGHWIRISERRLDDGGLVALCTDVTEIKRREEDLARKSAALEVILENIGQGITLVDSDHRLVAFNRMFQTLAGFRPDEIAPGYPYADLHRRLVERGTFRSSRESVGSAASEAELTRHDGTTLAVRRTTMADGGFVSTYTDVSEQRRIVRALQDSEERYALAMRGANEGLWDWDARTGQVYLSERALELAGLELQGPTITPAAWMKRIHPDDMDLYREPLLAHLRGTAPHYGAEYRVRGRDGAYRWVLTRGMGIRGSNRRVERMAGSIANITERKKAEIELLKAKERAEVADRIRTQILANLTHELRTPLNAILGIAEVLEEEANELARPYFAEAVRRIRGAGSHLLGLINQLLDLSAIEAGLLELRAEPVDVPDLLRTIVNRCQQVAERNGNRVELLCRPDLGAAYADPRRVHEALYNIVHNACKFTERGLVKVAAAREQADGNQGVSISVTDTGIGMSGGQLQDLSGLFYQVDGTTARRYGGAGVGLAVSRRLCDLMGGTLQITSELGQGTTVNLWLPGEIMSGDLASPRAAGQNLPSGTMPAVDRGRRS